MSIQLPYITVIPDGNLSAVFTYDTGKGYFVAYRTHTLIIECWGKGGKGGNSVTASLAGGGAGAGAYSKHSLSVIRGDIFKWVINATGDATVISVKYSLNMTANRGNGGSGATGGVGGTASGGSINQNGQNGDSTVVSTGGKGGDAYLGGMGGAGGLPSSNGSPGASPGGGGGGGGAGAIRGIGGAGGTARIKFSWQPIFGGSDT